MITFVVWMVALIIALVWSVITDKVTPIYVWLLFVIAVSLYGEYHHLLPWS